MNVLFHIAFVMEAKKGYCLSVTMPILYMSATTRVNYSYLFRAVEFIAQLMKTNF